MTGFDGVHGSDVERTRHQNALPGPEGEGDHRSRSPVRVAVVHARLSVRDRARRRGGRRGRRRQPLPRLRRRHRRQLDRRVAPRRRRGDHRAGAEVHPHVGDGLLLRAAGAAGGAAGVDRADRRGRPDASSATPARKRPRRRSSWRATHTKRQDDHRVPRRVPRPFARIAVADREQGDPAARVRSVDARRVSRAVSRYLPLQRQRRPVRGECAVASSRDQLFVHLSRPTKSPRSSSSRSRARAATSCRRQPSCRACGS